MAGRWCHYLLSVAYVLLRSHTYKAINGEGILTTAREDVLVKVHHKIKPDAVLD